LSSATGASLTGVTVIEIVAVAVSLPSDTWKLKESDPAKSPEGEYVTPPNGLLLRDPWDGCSSTS
jgi:hypothetical protein